MILANSCLRRDCIFCGIFVILGKSGQVRRQLGVWAAWSYGGVLELGLLGGPRWRLGLGVPGGAHSWNWTAAETLGDSFVWYGNRIYNS